jgi:hypothetical protein
LNYLGRTFLKALKLSIFEHVQGVYIFAPMIRSEANEAAYMHHINTCDLPSCEEAVNSNLRSPYATSGLKWMHLPQVGAQKEPHIYFARLDVKKLV